MSLFPPLISFLDSYLRSQRSNLINMKLLVVFTIAPWFSLIGVFPIKLLEDEWSGFHSPEHVC